VWRVSGIIVVLFSTEAIEARRTLRGVCLTEIVLRFFSGLIVVFRVCPVDFVLDLDDLVLFLRFMLMGMQLFS
jgi:hypothetical protein